MNAATSVKDEETFLLIYKGAKVIIILINLTKSIPGIHIISRIANDLLASAIFLNTNTKANWYWILLPLLTTMYFGITCYTGYKYISS